MSFDQSIYTEATMPMSRFAKTLTTETTEVVRVEMTSFMSLSRLVLTQLLI